MTSLVRSRRRSVTSLDDYATALNQFTFNGNVYPFGAIQQTLLGGQAERITNDLVGYATAAYAANGVVFACMAVRMLVFSAIRFTYQRFNNSRPSEMFGTTDLRLLETPWVGGTTQDMLLRAIQDADLAGNGYLTVQGGEIVRLRPDWVGIILEPRRIPGRNGGVIGYRRIGYAYQEGGLGAESRDATLLPVSEVAHFAPLPDPLATYRGMSWLTPVIREIQNDGLMSRHKRKFFENGATPNMVVSLDKAVSEDAYKRFADRMEASHRGVENAYRTMYLGGGADVTVVGSDLKQIDFKTVQGHGETRIAAAAGVPPVIVGLSEGLEAATYSNYAQARRRFADGTMHPLWQNIAGSLAPLLPQLPGARLWYDARDVPFLREDRLDAAQIAEKQAVTIRQLTDAGYTPESVVAAVMAEDYGLLKHTGLFSVQLQPPGAGDPPASALPAGGPA